jgi:hypothetical protein
MADWESCYHNAEISAVLASCTEANVTDGPELYACNVAAVRLIFACSMYVLEFNHSHVPSLSLKI